LIQGLLVATGKTFSEIPFVRFLSEIEIALNPPTPQRTPQLMEGGVIGEARNNLEDLKRMATLAVEYRAVCLGMVSRIHKSLGEKNEETVSGTTPTAQPSLEEAGGGEHRETPESPSLSGEAGHSSSSG